MLVALGYFDDFLDDERVMFGADADRGQGVVVVDWFYYLPVGVVLLHCLGGGGWGRIILLLCKFR